MDGFYFSDKWIFEQRKYIFHYCSGIEVVIAICRPGNDWYIARCNSQVRTFLQLCFTCLSLIKGIPRKEQHLASSMGILCRAYSDWLWIAWWICPDIYPVKNRISLWLADRLIRGYRHDGNYLRKKSEKLFKVWSTSAVASAVPSKFTFFPDSFSSNLKKHPKGDLCQYKISNS